MTLLSDTARAQAIKAIDEARELAARAEDLTADPVCSADVFAIVNRAGLEMAIYNSQVVPTRKDEADLVSQLKDVAKCVRRRLRVRTQKKADELRRIENRKALHQVARATALGLDTNTSVLRIPNAPPVRRRKG